MKKKKTNSVDTFINVNEVKVPLRILVERRNSIRIAVGKENVLLRVPVYSAGDINVHLNTTKNWLSEVSKKQPELLKKYHLNEIYDSIQILGRDSYKIKIENNSIDLSGNVSYKEGCFIVSLPELLDDFDKRILLRNLLSKILAKKYKALVLERLNYWNNMYFKKQIKGLTLRYNSSNWGSCSTTGKINISTRALLLPLDVFDYILVHELSHLVEMNHSDKFWNVVKSVMPNYEKSERWISKNTAYLDF